MLRRNLSGLALLCLACWSLSGCYYPFSYQTTESKFTNSPFRSTDVSVNKGNLSVHFSDPAIVESALENQSVRDHTLVQALLITDAGKQIPLKLWITILGDGVTYNFRLKESDFDEDHFKLIITVNLTGRPQTMTGEYSVHGHFKIVSLDDVAG
jgi:hypothetical protein